jgi:uncharacterized UPF0160 family protein
MRCLKNYMMKLNKYFGGKKIKLVTHDGSFHADDVFATAALSIMLVREGKDFEVIRSRNEDVIKSADYVYDVGLVYDPEANRFDHHQNGGAGRRENGIEYSSIGLVWKKFGEKIAGSKEVAKVVDNKLISPIDSADNGMSLVEFKNEIKPYFLQTMVTSFYPTWKNLNDEELYKGFMRAVGIAKEILIQEITQAKDMLEAENSVLEIYNSTLDKRIIVLDKKYPYEDILSKYPEPLFVVYPKVDGCWGAKAERENFTSFKNKKDFPKAWAGLRDGDLAKVTGVADAVFCHRVLFLAVAKSKEGAIKLAQIALES